MTTQLAKAKAHAKRNIGSASRPFYGANAAVVDGLRMFDLGAADLDALQIYACEVMAELDRAWAAGPEPVSA